jgi:hypothetical protein
MSFSKAFQSLKSSKHVLPSVFLVNGDKTGERLPAQSKTSQLGSLRLLSCSNNRKNPIPTPPSAATRTICRETYDSCHNAPPPSGDGATQSVYVMTRLPRQLSESNFCAAIKFNSYFRACRSDSVNQ